MSCRWCSHTGASRGIFAASTATNCARGHVADITRHEPRTERMDRARRERKHLTAASAGAAAGGHTCQSHAPKTGPRSRNTSSGSRTA
eukprot:2003078-Rhodomonas_salina.1